MPKSRFDHSISGPIGLEKPTIKVVMARSVSLSWKKPLISGGLITRYQLHAYPVLFATNVTQEILNVDMTEGTIDNLEANSMYLFTVEVFTSSGSLESDSASETTLPAGEL